MQVMLDVLSGRENPIWNVSEDQKEGLEAILANLQPTANVVEPPDLGYRGLYIEEEDDVTFPDIFIFNGVVTIDTDDGSRSFLDPDRKFEQAVLRTGNGHIMDDVYAELMDSIGQSTDNQTAC